ncbi:MAG TPA: ABC transporter substrate-binding protein, partial [bacterium]|nr:ABC transporter substrate-binding protein [bacterium]
YLLDLFELPHDLFHLYVPTAILTGKFDSMVTAMNLFAFALVGAAAMGGFLSPGRRAVTRIGLAAVVGVVVTVGATRLLLGATVDREYHKDEVVRGMHMSRDPEVAVLHRDRSTVDPADAAHGSLERILRRETLRVGYDPGNLPFSFFNADEELVGFDVELAHHLAAALGLRPEFVPVSWTELPGMLSAGEIDVMPSMWYRPFWFPHLDLSLPYMEGTMGLVVRDDRRGEFSSADAIRARPGLRIGVPLDVRQIRYSMERYFGDADVEFVVLEKPSDFFEGEREDIDAFLMPVEGASAATLLHPRYTVVVPRPDPVGIPFAFGVATGADGLRHRVNEWILFARSEGTIDDAYDYWVLGQGATIDRRRWSILHDVLGWGR